MKILMLSWEYPPRVVGGISRVVYDLSHRLIADGNDVTVITYRDGNTPYYEDDDGVKVYRIDNYMISANNFIDWILQLNFNMVAKAGEVIAEKGKFDIIHAHDWLVASAAKTLKYAYNTPIVSTIHAMEAGRNSGISTPEQKYINDTEWMLTYESSEVIVNSIFMKNELQRLFGLPYEKINVIPNGVNLHLYDDIDRDWDFRRNYAMDNEKIILFIGRLVYEKGIQNLIAAMPKILAGYNDAKLIVAGKGGMIDPIEAMLSGNPVVVSDAGGLNEIVDHGINGMKSYCGNPNSLADSILTLLFNKDLAETCSKNAIEKVKAKYNWTKIASDTNFTYQKAICETMAERQAKQDAQEEFIKKSNKASDITNLIAFKKSKEAFA